MKNSSKQVNNNHNISKIRKIAKLGQFHFKYQIFFDANEISATKNPYPHNIDFHATNGLKKSAQTILAKSLGTPS